jgi:protein SPT2
VSVAAARIVLPLSPSVLEAAGGSSNPSALSHVSTPFPSSSSSKTSAMIFKPSTSKRPTTVSTASNHRTSNGDRRAPRPPHSPKDPISSKRPRSPTYSLSPPPTKRRMPTNHQHHSLSDEIWSLFGKDKKKYMERDVLSDDEDMEADARVLHIEELRRLVSSYYALLCLVLMSLPY